MKKTLQTIYLRIDSSSKSLTKRALAQLLLKIIYFFDKPPSKEQIVSELTGILGASLNSTKIDEALDLLITDNKIQETKGQYIIDPNKRKKIKIAVDEFFNRQNRILDRYFGPIKTPPAAIVQWFEEVTIEFFNEYSSEWVSDLCLTTSTALKDRHRGIQAILDLVTEANKRVLEKDKAWLKTQYLKFLQSNDPDVTAILWDYGTSRFSSTLIVANTSIDPITIDSFTDSKCVLDTNVLMYLDLEKSKFKESFVSMEIVFANLKITPVYFFNTRDEFNNAMDYKKKETIRVVEDYAPEVVSQAVDPFLETALHRGCVSSEDFEEFFSQIMDIPKFFSDKLEIIMYDTKELDEAIEKGRQNEKLKKSINNVYRRKRRRDKRKHSLEHDAGLISGAEFIRKTEKCFILSRDSSINESALEIQAKNEIPISIGLDTLINLLAIDNGGTDIDPTNCAPLFASIIKLALVPEREVFKLEDLSRMLDVETQISSLPPADVIDIAKELHHNSVKGVSDEESSLQVNRRFQKAKLELQVDLQKSKNETHFEREEKEKYRSQSGKMEEKLRIKYTGELRDKYDSELRRNRIMIFFILPLITILITVLIIYSIESSQNESWTQYIIGIGLNIVAWALTDFLYLSKKIFNKYSERVNNIAEEVERKIKNDIQD
jgi:hypothetical protein